MTTYIDASINAPIGRITRLYTDDAEIKIVKTDNIQSTSGLNHITPWISSKQFVIDDLVTFDGQIYKCLTDNINVQPDPNDPTQLEWVLFTGDNIASNNQYVEINALTGNDTKAALNTKVPFATVTPAINHLISLGGGYAKITTVAPTTYASSVDIFSASNIVLDGGDQTDNFLDNPKNTILGPINVFDSSDITVKNLRMTRESDVQIFISRGSRNVTLSNMTSVDSSIVSSNWFRITSNGSTPFGSHSFINCSIGRGNNTSLAFVVFDTCEPGTLIHIDGGGLPLSTRFDIYTNSNGGLVNPSDIKFIIKNSTVNVSNFPHQTGMTIVLQNCIIEGIMSASLAGSTSGSLTMINCSFFNPLTGTWGGINLLGTAEYRLINCFLNPKSTTDSYNFIGNANNLYYTMGPAANFNRICLMGSGLATALVGSTRTQLLLGTVLAANDPFGLLSFVTPNSFRFNCRGVYRLIFELVIDNTINTADLSIINIWMGASSSTETTSGVARNYVSRPLVAAGEIGTYPTSLVTVEIVTPQIINPNTDRFIQVRNLGILNFNVTLNSLKVIQVY